MCPNCGSNNAECIDSRKRGSYIKRRKVCAKCLSRFNTVEVSEKEFDEIMEYKNAVKKFAVLLGDVGNGT